MGKIEEELRLQDKLFAGIDERIYTIEKEAARIAWESDYVD